LNAHTEPSQFPSLISNIELESFRHKTDELMADLEKNDISSALNRINEINEINGKSFYSVIGKLTRGLYDAISDLSISSKQDQSANDKTRVDLNYVINLTDNAAQKTLDMTEKSRSNIQCIAQQFTTQSDLLEEYSSLFSKDDAGAEFLQKMKAHCQEGTSNISTLNSNVSEIVMAQNYQDIASQSITKAIHIIKEVENSLVALTQYANLLTKLSQYSASSAEMDQKESDDLKSNIGQLNNISTSEHLDQGDVDDLLSSLGF